VKGIEPSSQAWEARILPLNHTRPRMGNSVAHQKPQCKSILQIGIYIRAVWALNGDHA
jgi:hypothetical protein